MLRQFLIPALFCACVGSVYSDTNYRLNTTIIPSAYSILITPYFDTGDNRAFTFDGEVTITFTPGSDINSIKLHSQDLIYTAADISLTTVHNGSSSVTLHADNPLQFDQNYTFAIINLQNEMPSGRQYVLTIRYRGPIRTDLSGFYRSYYIQTGVKKWLGATQLEPTHARKVFPCFDEPALKAVFTLTIDRPQSYKPTLANTKLQSSVTLENGYVRETFYPTPTMSTYLLAFLVSDFEHGNSITSGDNKFGVYSRPEATNQSQYAFEFGRKVVRELGTYFGINYYSTDVNIKLDHVALPDFYAGAMENWGLAKYREALLLYVPEESAPNYKYTVAQIVAHETTHMWFGNLITCHWWSDIWLNEGFANYFHDYITSLIEPELGAGDMLVIGSVYTAYNVDSDTNSPPITKNNVNSPSEIFSHFNSISYQKAGSVIRMMHHLIGDDAFKSGLNIYLLTDRFGSGNPDKLYSALIRGVDKFMSLSNYPNINLTSIMDSWITQSGHPILQVDVNEVDSTIILTQNRFYIDSSHSSEEIYKIPITYTIDIDFDFSNTKPAFIMENKTHVLYIREIRENHTTPIFNIQETGLYRVNYDSYTWHKIAEILKGNRREEIHYLNRAKIVNDLFAFLFADKVKFHRLKKVLQFLENETEYAVWSVAILSFNKLRSYYLGSDILALIDVVILKVTENAISKLGFEVRDGDNFVTLRTRMEFLVFACRLGHQGCINKSVALFQDFKNNGKWIHPSLREAAYCMGLKYGNGDDYDFLWNRMATTNVANEMALISKVLGCSNDQAKLNSYLVSMLVENSPIRTQDLYVPLNSVLGEYSNVNTVVEALKQNVSLWKSIYPNIGTVLSSIASAMHTVEEYDAYNAWLTSCDECGVPAVESAQHALDLAFEITDWADKHRNMLWQFLIPALLCAYIGSVYSDTNYRLNTTIVPSAYSILITPYFDTGDNRAFTFDGEVAITFTPGSDINSIKLHSQDLNYTADNISLTTGSSSVTLHADNPLQFDQNYTFVIINLQNEITSGRQYVLTIRYRGPIRTDLNGFYRNYYIQNGVKKWLGATQLEPTHARKVFPCFDEPALKAVFTLTIDRPQSYKPTLANTKLQSSVTLENGYVRETFYPTPIMSTYLVAFLVSDFEHGDSIINGDNEFGVYSRPDATNQSQYAFEFGQKVVSELGTYFGIDYYSTDVNIKLDHIALPDFNSGAMENWGLVKYREALLLYVPEESTPYYKYRVAQIVAHETTHMWFGNLVTCHWWSDIWLNEGFANYFQDYITSLIEPEVGAGDMLVIGSVHTAYDGDSDIGSSPITNNNVNSPSEISSHFGSISYQKAGSVIRMMHHLIGDEAFKNGLNSYLLSNQFGSGYPDRLYSALTGGVDNFMSLSNYPNINFTSIMDSWITQSGYPILQVDVNEEDSTITLTQKRFYINSSHSSEEIYKIPITYTIDTNFDFSNTKPAFIMENKTYVLHIQEIGENHTTPIFNIQETGLYRVNYDNHTWLNIAELLKGNRREEIHYLNRAKIVNDLFAFLFADEVKFELFENVLQFLENETEYAVWSVAIRGFNKLRNYYLGSDSLALIDEFALKLTENAISKLGYEVRDGDNFVTLKTRMELLVFTCRLGHQGCINNSVALFQDFKNNGKWIHPSLREAAYCMGLKHGNGDDYDFLWNRMATTNVANEMRLISGVLGCSNDQAKLNSYLVSMLVENSPIRTQDLNVPLNSVLGEYSNVNIVVEALKQNVSLWKSIYPNFGTVLSSIAAAMHTPEEFDAYNAWLTSCDECGLPAVESAKHALDLALKITDWADQHRSDIRSSLGNDARAITPSILLLVLGVITLSF
ncbi:unnamed protein product [Euphydryas editha]|uniref:Aminopeptidase N n=1 Tax=Euphydryas editha TaxID=104508 RepID=A0AAU9V2Z0_EUPED|nr:unnamed protein product [Euphydryas editha]